MLSLMRHYATLRDGAASRRAKDGADYALITKYAMRTAFMS